VLDQTPQLDDIDLAEARAAAVGDPPPLGPYRTYQVPISDIAELTGLELGQLIAADRLATAPVPTGRPMTTTPAGCGCRAAMTSWSSGVRSA
jgi:endonuclease G